MNDGILLCCPRPRYVPTLRKVQGGYVISLLYLSPVQSARGDSRQACGLSFTLRRKNGSLKGKRIVDTEWMLEMESNSHQKYSIPGKPYNPDSMESPYP